MKLITFTVPCYNSAEYMDRCIRTLLPAGEEAEIILVDDGSTDDTPAIADRWQREYPGIVRAVHQENGGHGEGVNHGLRIARGLYFQVVDSDDWLDDAALQALMAELRRAAGQDPLVDLFICNYVYEHTADHSTRPMRYRNALPKDRVFGWSEVGRLSATQFITMHSAVYRTEVLRACGLSLPKHIFYVDNLFVYQPLPHVETMAYLDIDLYRYFIGRADQSVTEENLIRRIDQQIQVTQMLADSHDLEALRRVNPRLARYLCHYLSIMMMICTIYLMLSGTREDQAKSHALWRWLRENHPALWRKLRYRSANIVFLLPGKAGRSVLLFCYRMIRRIYKFN